MENSEIIIDVVGMYKKFGDFIANNDLNFSVYKGEIFGFLGANGAGKTTAIKILCGLSQPSKGIIKVAGFDIYKEREKIKNNIGYMSQKFSLYEDLTVFENFRFYGGIYGLTMKEIKMKADILLEKLELKEVRNTLISELPLGWRQKLAFSVAIIHDPKIVFLDEPTSGVDPITRRHFWNMIYEEASLGLTIFITTHNMEEAEYCDRASIMVDGKIVAIDTPAELIKKYNAKTMNDVFIEITRPNRNT